MRQPTARDSFEGRTIVVTGGAGDIGYATAAHLSASGAHVALLDIDEAMLAERKEALEAEGSNCVLGVVCDVTAPASVAAAFGTVEQELGSVHHVFNNAGRQGDFAPIDRYDADDFARVVAVNLTGVFHVLKAAVDPLRTTRGTIVNTASYAGVVGPPNMAAYAASKFGVVGLTQTAAKDLAPLGIRVNAISPSLIGPGAMWSRQSVLQAAAGSPYFSADPREVERSMIGTVPLRRLGTLDEVARAVAFLMSDDASYITGFNLVLNGGQ
jgi:2-dehydro-3-deoxy-L-rhamnonate dehydrogenase (NAD+)